MHGCLIMKRILDIMWNSVVLNKWMFDFCQTDLMISEPCSTTWWPKLTYAYECLMPWYHSTSLWLSLTTRMTSSTTSISSSTIGINRVWLVDYVAQSLRNATWLCENVVWQVWLCIRVVQPHVGGVRPCVEYGSTMNKSCSTVWFLYPSFCLSNYPVISTLRLTTIWAKLDQGPRMKDVHLWVEYMHVKFQLH